MVQGIDEDPDQTWQNIQNANPEITLFQAFDQDGREIIYRGPEEGRLRAFSELARLQSRLPVIETIGSLTILRVLAKPEVSGRTIYAVLGISYPKKLDEYASLITESRSNFRQLLRFESLFRVAIVLFYILSSSPIFLISILVSFLLTDEIIKPIVNLEEATRRIAEGDFSFRILTRTKDELSALVGSFNRMISELESSRAKLVQAEKISAWQDIAQRLAHEIKNPLTPIKLSAQRILRRYTSRPQELGSVLEPAVSAIVNEVDNLNKLLLEFRDFARLPNPASVDVDIKRLVEEAISIYENLSRNVEFNCRFMSGAVTVRADRDQMKQVFANLFKNAIQAMPDGGNINVITDVVTKDDNRYLRIQIKDTGVGMGDHVKTKIFEPYYTTKKDGTGLGLSIVERIIFDHNGSIWFETKKGSGTTFFIDLPLENHS